jgi:hypothetical protein
VCRDALFGVSVTRVCCVQGCPVLGFCVKGLSCVGFFCLEFECPGFVNVFI